MYGAGDALSPGADARCRARLRTTDLDVSRIYLSPPDVGPAEREALLTAFDGGWIAPVGPEVDAFEREVAAITGTRHAAALSSGTAALHLALLASGVGPGDEVLVPTLTFVATASPVVHIGAEPTFIDCEPGSWNIDPSLVADLLDERAQQGRLPAAVIAVDLYGQCADADALAEACRPHGVALIEDAAEALGATYHGRPAGSLAPVGVISFNGNKIITTSGGGMLVSDDEAMVARARHLATQAREPAPHYEHTEIGFNYRMSNLLAALGRAQLRSLPERIARRRAIKARYRAALEDGHGITFMPDDAERRADQLVDRRPDRPLPVRRHGRRHPPGARGRGHRIPAGVEAPALPARVRGPTRRRWHGGRADLRARPVPAERQLAHRCRGRPGGRARARRPPPLILRLTSAGVRCQVRAPA